MDIIGATPLHLQVRDVAVQSGLTVVTNSNNPTVLRIFWSPPPINTPFIAELLKMLATEQAEFIGDIALHKKNWVIRFAHQEYLDQIVTFHVALTEAFPLVRDNIHMCAMSEEEFERCERKYDPHYVFNQYLLELTDKVIKKNGYLHVYKSFDYEVGGFREHLVKHLLCDCDTVRDMSTKTLGKIMSYSFQPDNPDSPTLGLKSFVRFAAERNETSRQIVARRLALIIWDRLDASRARDRGIAVYSER